MRKLFAIAGTLLFTIMLASPVFAVPVLPDGETHYATYVTDTTATFNAYITDDGGEACDVRFQYYIEGGAWTDTETAWVAGYLTGESATADLTGLTEDAIYYVRVQIKNSAGTFTDSDYVVFTPNSASPTMPSRWFATPDVERFKYAFFYGMNNLIADRLDMDRDVFYMLSTLFWCVVIAILALIIGKRLVPAVIALCGSMALASLVTLLPMFFMAFSAIGIWGALKMGHPREE